MRLSRETVQIRIAEMHDAINGSSDNGRAIEEANLAESRLLSQLALQNRMDEHAPEMLDVLKLALIRLEDAVRLFEPKGQDRADLQAAASRARVVIAKIEKE